jgi:hypothetical protein
MFTCEQKLFAAIVTNMHDDRPAIGDDDNDEAESLQAARDAWHGTRESRFRRRRLRDLPSTGDIGMSGAFRGVARDGGQAF